MYQGKKSYWIKHLDFIIMDFILTEAAYFCAVIIRKQGIADLTKNDYMLGLVLAVIFAFVILFTGCYHGILRKGYFQLLKSAVQLIFLNLVLLSAFMFMQQSGLEYSRFVWVMTGILSLLLMYPCRIVLKTMIVRRNQKKTGDTPQMLVFSTKDHAAYDLEKLIKHGKYEDYQITGVVIIDQDMRGQEIEGVPVVGYRGDALEYTRKSVVDEVFLHFTDLQFLQDNLMQYFQRMGITVHICLAENTVGVSGKRIVESVGGFTVVSNSIRIAKPEQLFVKRCLDIAGGLVGTMITVVLAIILGPIIYIQSPGPIFFSQTRIGKNGRKFKIYKFRSMYPDAEQRKAELMKQNKMNGLMFKMDNDPRIIPIGKFIRATSLDEFPQFINVLKGDMSLVGTRPPTEDEYIYYEDYHKRRLATRPGITGMWQVSGRSDITDFEEVVALDSKYIENWGIGLDIKILFQTVAAVFARKGSV